MKRILPPRAEGAPPPSLKRARTWKDLVFGFYDGVVKHRTTGLAAEVAFFALFSIPPAFLAFFGALGFVGKILGKDFADGVRGEVIQSAHAFFIANAETARKTRRWSYAHASVPVYLLIDRFDEDGPAVTLFSDPVDGHYRHSVRIPFGEKISLPEPFGIDLDTGGF